MQQIIKERRYRVPNKQTIPFTIGLIGKAIRDSSSYIPIRNYAASAAAPARRKNYPEQLKNIFDAFVSRWRYVRDPHGTETVTTSPRAVAQCVIGLNGGIGPSKYGAGDCDDATVGLGAMLLSAGFPVRIATTAPLGYPGIGFTHVFPQAHIRSKGWVTADPVLLPHAGLGDITPHSRIAIWDLKGNLIASRGVPAKVLKKAYKMQRRNNVTRKRTI